MYIPAAILENGYHYGQRSNLRICDCFFLVILGPENVYLDTKIKAKQS